MRRARWPGRAARSRVTATESARRAMTRWRMTVSRVLAANSVARRAWLEPDQLLATRSADELLELLG